jgi:hypothetical protein
MPRFFIALIRKSGQPKINIIDTLKNIEEKITFV